ncbi:MAG: hypothetical protein ACXW2D_11910, partial [Burkholderiaceae bacterium]
RGVELTNAGQAIAVQNFCENLSVMAMVATYAALLGHGTSLVAVVVGLAVFVSLAMLGVQWHRRASADGGTWQRDASTRLDAAAGPRRPT